ncbi:MAG: hypothetical protein FJX68_02515 [Alphaproteobacteria bacterium]|nr:hypothetical protein [Alphaproteobacteria bacterium]
MIYAAAEPAVRKTVEVNGRPYVISEYVGQSPKRGRYVEGADAEGNSRRPQGFLVEQPAGAVTPPHFHEVDQFQVVVEGAARFGKHPAPPLSVHYASGHTPYGPVAAGADGVVYYTLRAGWDPGAKYMPAQRDKLRPPPRRARFAQAAPVAAPSLAGRLGVQTETLMTPEADGLAAWRLLAGPGAMLAPPAPLGGGQYIVVVEGDFARAGETFGKRACLFLEPGEAPLDGVVGEQGLDLLVLQLPADTRTAQ